VEEVDGYLGDNADLEEKRGCVGVGVKTFEEPERERGEGVTSFGV
jgi:hypothetical protein